MIHKSKNILLSACIFLLAFTMAHAQSWPSDWMKYSSSEVYIRSYVRETNTDGLSEKRFTDYLKERVRKDLSAQIQTHVKSEARTIMQILDGHATIDDQSISTFTTDITLEMVNVEDKYDPVSGIGQAIAFIKKSDACFQYQKKLSVLLGSANTAISNHDTYISIGNKTKAKEEIAVAVENLAEGWRALAWLCYLDYPAAMINEYVKELSHLEVKLKKMQGELDLSMAIYVDYKPDVFGNSFPVVTNAINELLTSNGWKLATAAAPADYVIVVSATATDEGMVPQSAMHWIRLEISIRIDRKAAGTLQTVYSNTFQARDSGNEGRFAEAAERIFRDIRKEMIEVLKTNIK